VYLPKRQSTKKATTTGLSQKCADVYTKRAARARTALLNNSSKPPSQFQREVMGYSYAEADALIYRIRPTLRPPVEDGNRTQNPGKRTSTRGAGAPLAGGHTRCEINGEENWSAAHSALIASFELCRKGIPSKWKDRLSAQGLTMQPFKVSVEIANALINGAPETAAAEVLKDIPRLCLINLPSTLRRSP